ncbi:hypothetical protein D3C86_1938910 [compost metagenome]
MLGDDGLPFVGHLAERFVPGDAAQHSGTAFIAHLRIQQAPVQAHRLAQRGTLDAQLAQVGRMVLVAGHGNRAVALRRGLHAAADAAVRASGLYRQIFLGQVHDNFHS